MDALVINAIAFEEDGMWVAQCLEFDFVSFARTKEDLPRILVQQVLAQIEIDSEDGNAPFFEFKPAPAKYWGWFEEVRTRATPISESFAASPVQRVETQLFSLAA